MRLSKGKDYSFRRPKEVQAFQFQFSEITLSKEWSIGRKKLHHLLLHMEELGMLKLEISRDSSICTITCIKSIEDETGNKIFIPP